MNRYLLPLLSLLAGVPFWAAGHVVEVSNFSEQDLSLWQERSFAGNTSYQIVSRDNQQVVMAESQASASLIAIKRRIDLKETPYINWSWLIKNRLSGLDEVSREGDDYSARIYVVVAGGWLPSQKKALNYVWSGNQQTGSRWDNAFVPNNAKMIAVRGKDAPVNKWQQEKRNVFKDLINAYGDKGSMDDNEEAYRYLDAVAIMTDTDNSGLNAVAYYGDIRFTQQ